MTLLPVYICVIFAWEYFFELNLIAIIFLCGVYMMVLFACMKTCGHLSLKTLLTDPDPICSFRSVEKFFLGADPCYVRTLHLWILREKNTRDIYPCYCFIVVALSTGQVRPC